MELEGRVAIVTGGDRGVGRGISLALARAGAKVAINYRRDEAAARETVSAIQALGGQAQAFQADVTDYPKVKEMADATVEAFGKVDILVNNAGIASRGDLVSDTDLAELERVVRTHAFGAFYFTKAVLPVMRRQPRGDILFISSRAALDCPPGYSLYVMGKAALEGLAKVVAKEEGKNNIRVNIVALGIVETEMGRRLARATAGVQDIKELYPQMPFGRVCQPEDVGNLVVFLCSQRGEYISGHAIYLDGGASLRQFTLYPDRA